MKAKKLKEKKSPKLIWNNSETDFSKLVMARIHDELWTQEWFEGEIGFLDKQEEFEPKEEEEAVSLFNRFNLIPSGLSIRSTYKKHRIEVRVKWDKWKPSQCSTYLNKPNTDKYFPEGSGTPKTKSSRHVKGVLERIKKALQDGILGIEAEITREKERAQAKIIAKKFKEALCTKLGVPLTRDQYSGPYNFEYGKDRTFGMCFTKIETKENLFEIDTISGTFTTATIKKLIKLIGGNPRAAAARLTGRKE